MRALQRKKKFLAVAEPSSPFWIYTCRYKRAISISLGISLEKHARAFFSEEKKIRPMFQLIMRVMITEDDDCDVDTSKDSLLEMIKLLHARQY